MALASRPTHKRYEGMRLAEIAVLRDEADPANTGLEWMAEDGGAFEGSSTPGLRRMYGWP